MTDFQPRNALITGGAGFIGSNFVRYWLHSDSQVRIVNLDDLTYAGNLRNLDDLPDPRRHVFAKGSICDSVLVGGLLRQHSIDTIVHFAAESHVDRSIDGPAAFVQTNVIGTFVLLEEARKYWQEECNLSKDVCRFHQISTDEVYGALGDRDPPFTESSPYAPNSPYSACKAAADHLVRAYHRTYGLPVTTSNSSNNYGPYQHTEKFIPTVIRACMEGKPIPIYGDGSNIRDWLHVEDHCRGIDMVIRRGLVGETYNLGGGNERCNIQIARMICRLMDDQNPGDASYERLVTFVRDRPGHDWRYAIDSKKVERELAWKPQESFESGLIQTIKWFLGRQDRRDG